MIGYPLSMTTRSPVITPLPAAESKHLVAMIKIDTSITETFKSVRQLHALIKTQSTSDEISEEALCSLLRASWTIENAQEGARQHVLNRNKYAYRSFLLKLKHIQYNAESIIQRCKLHSIIPFKLVAEAMLFGGDINASMYRYK